MSNLAVETQGTVQGQLGREAQGVRAQEDGALRCRNPYWVRFMSQVTYLLHLSMVLTLTCGSATFVVDLGYAQWNTSRGRKCFDTFRGSAPAYPKVSMKTNSSTSKPSSG